MIRIETVDAPVGSGSTAAMLIAKYWRSRPDTFWLDSACDPQRLGRFSFLGTAPYATLRAAGSSIRYISHIEGERTSAWSGDPLRALADVAEPVFATPFPDGFAAPFAGGLVGYISYDVGSRLAALPLRPGREHSGPDLAFGLYDAVVCIDHVDNEIYIVSTGLPLTGPAAAKRADERLAWLRRELERALHGDRSVPYGGDWASPAHVASRPDDVAHAAASGPALGSSLGTVSSIAAASRPEWRVAGGALSSALQSSFTYGAYLQRVEHVLALIEAGTVEQVNLAQRFTMPTNVNGLDLYECLRSVSPAPYAAFLRVDDAWILSSSPERLLHIRGDHIETRPIKGTRPRGHDDVTDARNRAALLASKKDAAEHAMIVDLAQAELESICTPDSVHVAEGIVCEEYATVFHLVSTVAGRLAPDTDRIECVRALFPGASVTGRPKLRAMQLIDELEPVGRGVYTGTLGYFGVGGHVDLNVAIRTIVLQDGRAQFHVGGAIVSGSRPDDEYEETLDKAEGMVRALLSPGR